MSNFDLCKTHSELTYLMILLEKNCALERFACRVSQFVRQCVRPSPAPRILLPSRSEIQPQQEQTETDSYYECRAAAGRRVGDQIYCREEENCGDESERGNRPMHAVPNTHVLWRRCTTDIQIFAKVPRDSLSSSEGPRRNLKEQVVFSDCAC